MGHRLGYLEQGSDYEGAAEWLFDHLRDVFASGFRIRAVSFFVPIFRACLGECLCWWRQWSESLTLTENMFEFGLRDAQDLQRSSQRPDQG